MKTLLTKGRKRSEVIIDGEKFSLAELSLADAQKVRDDSDPLTPARTIALSVVGEDGLRIYSESDVPALHDALSVATSKQLIVGIQKLNRIDVPGDSPGPKP